MIIGIGSDLADIRGIEQTIERCGDRFVQRVVAELERHRPEQARALVLLVQPSPRSSAAIQILEPTR